MRTYRIACRLLRVTPRPTVYMADRLFAAPR
jgi:hypothetical protein